MSAVPLYPAHTFTLRMFVAVRAELAAYSQRQIAATMGITEARVSTILSGGQNLTIETIARLLVAAERLGAHSDTT